MNKTPNYEEYNKEIHKAFREVIKTYDDTSPSWKVSVLIDTLVTKRKELTKDLLTGQ